MGHNWFSNRADFAWVWFPFLCWWLVINSTNISGIFLLIYQSSKSSGEKNSSSSHSPLLLPPSHAFLCRRLPLYARIASCAFSSPISLHTTYLYTSCKHTHVSECVCTCVCISECACAVVWVSVCCQRRSRCVANLQFQCHAPCKWR